MRLKDKCIIILGRFGYYFRTLQRRIIRVIIFVFQLLIHFFTKPIRSILYLHINGLKLLFLVFDLIAIPEIFQCFTELIKWNSIGLSSLQIEEAQKVFKGKLQYHLISVDHNSFIGPRQHKFAYVSFHTINLHGKLSDHLLIHELIHVWQYERFGSRYIVEAWLAQNSKDKYDYGGIQNLKLAIEDDKTFKDFNFEQQGDIVADYYRLLNNEEPQWGSAMAKDISVYRYFVDQMLDEKASTF